MLDKKLFPYALLVLSQSAIAVDIPSAGGQMQQIPPTPTQQKSAPQIEFQRNEAPAIPKSEEKIRVKRLNITGVQVYSEAELIAAAEFIPDSELSLFELRGMALKIADYYHRNGYFVAQAYLPAQDINDGVVTIAVIVGQYGEIKLNNETNLSNHLATGLLEGLDKGDLIQSDPLENRLLLLSDLPGVKINSTLVPGRSIGSSDLLVDVKPGQRVTGSIDADNAGNRYTGMYRAGGTVNLNNPFGQGDVVSLRALTSGSGLNYGRASYQMQFGKATAGVAYSYLEYELGKEFKSLQAHGTMQVGSIYASYPLIRSRKKNLYVQLAYDEKAFQDRIDVDASVVNKRAHVLRSGLYGDYRDNLGGGGLNAYSLTLSTGYFNIETPEVRAIDAATVKTNGYYNKLGLYAMRLQTLTDSISLFASVNGQWASKNLDISEKMELGGMYGVRAYPEGEAYGDQGFVFTVEPRLQLPKISDRMLGQMQLVGFVDVGAIVTNTNSWTTGRNSRTLSGAGIGLTWIDINDFAVRTYYAHRLGHEDSFVSPNSSGQFWIQAVKYF